jgi:hypothetical protein
LTNDDAFLICDCVQLSAQWQPTAFLSNRLDCIRRRSSNGPLLRQFSHCRFLKTAWLHWLFPVSTYGPDLML